MKIINREMGGGKTTALLELMAGPDGHDIVYVAPSMAQARRAKEMFDKYYGGNSDRRFISVGQLGGIRGSSYPTPRFVIDEADGVLGHLLGGQVVGIAGTDEDLKRGQINRLHNSLAEYGWRE